MTWKQLLWIVVIPSFLGHHRAAMRELWQQSKPCLGHWARARHDGTGGACVKTCWNRLRQVTHGFWTTVKQSLFCGATGLEVGWAELRVVSGAHSPSCWSFWGWEWFEWSNGGMELHSSKSVARARRKAFTWTCWWATMRRNMHPMSVPQWMTDHRLRCFECLNYIINILYSYNNIFIFAIIHHVCSEWTEMDGGTMTGG